MTQASDGSADLRRYQMHIGGRHVDAVSGATFASLNPYTGAAWAEVPDADETDVDLAVRSAREALAGPWGELQGVERSRLLRRLGDIVAREADALAAVETRDNGKLLREMSGQMHYLPEWFYYFAGLADKIQGEVIPNGRANFLTYTRHEPVGVVGAIVPWNSPLLLMVWKLAPALAAGCTFVVKPSDYTPVSTLAFAELVEEAGFPPGVFNVVTGRGPASGKALAAHPDVDKVAFTGSTATGADVAASAAQHLARVSLELGGKSAQVVFADADLDAAANGVIAGVFAATGQTCMAGSRLLVHEDVHDALVERIVARANTVKLGDPADPETEMGPVSNQAQYDKVLHYLDAAEAEGGTIACGGAAGPEVGGLFVRPTVVTGARSGMKVVDEEIFGPVVAVIPFTTEDEAIAAANSTPYGLAGAVWTKDVHRAHRVAHRLRAGSVWVNAYRVVAPGVPFGGFKLSGIGRENGIDAIREYTETKAIWVELSGDTRDPFVLG
ncbi:MAG: aldehyde dehydrogenase family protein [Streptosporangiales bacterium]|nr:aldehyde dehydrogenase family protein [Streptosporangiales bacterium]